MDKIKAAMGYSRKRCTHNQIQEQLTSKPLIETFQGRVQVEIPRKLNP